MQIKYRKGYKYQLAETYTDKIPVIGYNIDSEFIKVDPEGNLTIKRGYAWDGASGPTWDDETNMRGSLVHDAMFQLMRDEYLPKEYFKVAQNMLYEDLLEDGMNRARAWIYYQGVGTDICKLSSLPENRKKVYVAPNK